MRVATVPMQQITPRGTAAVLQSNEALHRAVRTSTHHQIQTCNWRHDGSLCCDIQHALGLWTERNAKFVLALQLELPCCLHNAFCPQAVILPMCCYE